MWQINILEQLTRIALCDDVLVAVYIAQRTDLSTQDEYSYDVRYSRAKMMRLVSQKPQCNRSRTHRMPSTLRRSIIQKRQYHHIRTLQHCADPTRLIPVDQSQRKGRHLLCTTTGDLGFTFARIPIRLNLLAIPKMVSPIDILSIVA